jgi:hypothetical protein
MTSQRARPTPLEEIDGQYTITRSPRINSLVLWADALGSHRMKAPRSLLDEVLPRFDASEVHDVWVPAPPHVVFASAKQVTVREVHLLRPLEAMRALPGLLARRPVFRPKPSARVLDQFTTGVVPLGERADTEIVAGAIGRFWRLIGNETAEVRTREDFLSFDEPGYAKAAISFLVRPERGGSRVITETRVAGTSPDATRAMLRYWRAIRLGSGAIRRSWLAGIRRRAVRTVNVDAGRD